MKGHYIFSALLGIGLLLQGCETLDYTPADQLNDKTFWRTEQHANQAAVALYAAMKAGWAFGRDFTFDMISDIADGTSPHAGIARGTSFSSGDASVQNTWQYLYEVVHRSNTVIRNVSAMDIDETVKTRVIGEAKFLRAMAYFRMLNCWGGVPYYDESCIIEEEFHLVQPARIGRNHPRSHSRRPDGCHLQTSCSLGNIRLRACHERGCLRFAREGISLQPGVEQGHCRF